MASLQQFQDRDRATSRTTSIPLAGPDERPGNLPQRACLIWKRLPVPVIGALHGVAYGAGAQIALGLITHVAEDPHAQAMDLAREIASKSPHAIRSGKQLFEESWHADERTGLELETKLQVELIGSENQVEAIRANFDKRAPDFKDAG
jgi:enoyl-CoA hydratase/carnithine racemase